MTYHSNTVWFNENSQVEIVRLGKGGTAEVKDGEKLYWIRLSNLTSKIVGDEKFEDKQLPKDEL